MLEWQTAERARSAVGSWRSRGDGPIEVVVASLVAGVEQIHAATAVLSDDERHRASRFVFDRDRRRFILGRARVRQLLGIRLGIPPEAVELTYGKKGKPSVRDSDLRFNVAHCDDLAVVALSNRRDVGIDVEAVRPLADADTIAAHFFSGGENEEYRALDAVDKPAGFFNCWTRKEAFIKALGEGFSYSLDRFDVSLAPGQPARILRVDGAPGPGCGWSMESFTPAPGYVAAVVSASDRTHD